MGPKKRLKFGTNLSYIRRILQMSIRLTCIHPLWLNQARLTHSLMTVMRVSTAFWVHIPQRQQMEWRGESVLKVVSASRERNSQKTVHREHFPTLLNWKLFMNVWTVLLECSVMVLAWPIQVGIVGQDITAMEGRSIRHHRMGWLVETAPPDTTAQGRHLIQYPVK